MSAPKPFTIHVDNDVLLDLRVRLARVRWPDEPPENRWRYGTDLAYMRQLVDYWRDKYDWRAQEKRLNQFDQFMTTIDGVEIHFIHQRSKNPNAMPVVDRIALDNALKQLPPGYRTVFVLHDVEGHEHEEIAKMLGVAVGIACWYERIAPL